MAGRRWDGRICEREGRGQRTPKGVRQKNIKANSPKSRRERKTESYKKRRRGLADKTDWGATIERKGMPDSKGS